MSLWHLRSLLFPLSVDHCSRLAVLSFCIFSLFFFSLPLSPPPPPLFPSLSLFYVFSLISNPILILLSLSSLSLSLSLSPSISFALSLSLSFSLPLSLLASPSHSYSSSHHLSPLSIISLALSSVSNTGLSSVYLSASHIPHHPSSLPI